MFLLEILYLISAIALAAYGFNSLFHAWLFWRSSSSSERRSQWPGIPHLASKSPGVDPSDDLEATDRSESTTPHVTIQLPIYNERHVAARLVEAVLELQWPSKELQIQILDDSSDDTSDIIAATLARHKPFKMAVEHIRRPNRIGFKAGALQHGLCSSQSGFVAIFDADFIPPPDFLHRTIPAFHDNQVGCIQTRWGHVNPHTSLLTEAQSLGIDGHFRIEQYVRDQIGAFLNFNGTAGVWRRACMDDAGGWQHDTLTEDLDLSYRAQLAGWRIAYQVDVPVPAELPVQIDAFKRQQFRWAKGSLQTARKLLIRLWRSSSQPPWRKILGTLHLTNYMVHPFMVLNLLLLLPISFSQSPVLYAAPFMTTAAIGPPIMYWLAMREQDLPIWTKIRKLSILMALGTGLSINNTKAALEAFTGIESEFKRTPKFALAASENASPSAASSSSASSYPISSRSGLSDTSQNSTLSEESWYHSSYALARHSLAWLELAMALYALYLLLYCIQSGMWWMLIWILMYVTGYGYIALLAFQQSWQIRQARSALQV
ncbi:MAG: glycosyltransferase [Chloroflexota bacterium]